MARLLRRLLKRFHHCGQCDKHFKGQGSFRSWLTQAGPPSWQTDRAQGPAFAHIQPPFAQLALKQNVQLLAPQRVEWMGDNQRTQRNPARPRIMS